MIKNFIDELEVFKTNKNLTLEVVEIKSENESAKIVIVDNFYENPDLVRNLALSIPPTTNERITSYLPSGKNSGRINAFYLMDSLGPVYDRILRETFPEILLPEFAKSGRSDQIVGSFMRATFMANVMTSENLPPRVPHIDCADSRAFASSVYLNTNDECKGGTGFYSFGGKIFSNKNYNTIDLDEKILPNKFVIEDEGDWKKLYVAEMKYNRMVLYQQNIFHNAYIDDTMFNNNMYRLNQQFFI
jgi:hypothetical protein